MTRSEMLRRLESHPHAWDMIVVGGGATGVGVAIDAAARGYDVLLLEQSDFGKGTSSRSTKLAHGGVRYLEQGNIGLVMEALKERGLLLQNAPHIVHDLAFVVPNYDWWEASFTAWASSSISCWPASTLRNLAHSLQRRNAGTSPDPEARRPARRRGLLRRTIRRCPAADPHGGDRIRAGRNLAELCRSDGLTKDAQGFIDGVTARDVETGNAIRANAKVVINATGAFSDQLRLKAEPAARR